MVWLLAASLAGSWAYLEGHREVARWYLAMAAEDREGGNDESAQRRFERALAWAPGEPGFYLQRAEWRLEDRQHEQALEDCERAEALAGHDHLQLLMLRSQINRQLGRYEKALEDWNAIIDQVGGEHYSLLEYRIQLYEHLGRIDDALEDFEVIDRLSHTRGIPDRGSALNSSAYLRAVGNVKHAAALEQVNSALRFRSTEPNFLDTRGYLYYRQGKYEAALDDLNRAIPDLEWQLRRVPEISPHVRRLSSRSSRAEANLRKTGLAVVYYHRALVLDKLDRPDEAAQDRARVRDLIGREPDESLF